MAIASLQDSLFNDFIVLEIQTMDGVAVSPDDIQQGIDAAQLVLNQAGVSAFEACGTSEKLSQELHDAFESGDDESMDYYVSLGAIGNAWLRARDSALEIACRNAPVAMYQYRMYVEWDGREPGKEEESWGMYKNGGTSERTAFAYPE